MAVTNIIKGTEIIVEVDFNVASTITIPKCIVKAYADRKGKYQEIELTQDKIINNTFDVYIDTNKVSEGKLILDVTFCIADDNASDDTKEEVIRIETDINIIK